MFNASQCITEDKHLAIQDHNQHHQHQQERGREETPEQQPMDVDSGETTERQGPGRRKEEESMGVAEQHDKKEAAAGGQGQGQGEGERDRGGEIEMDIDIEVEPEMDAARVDAPPPDYNPHDDKELDLFSDRTLDQQHANRPQPASPPRPAIKEPMLLMKARQEILGKRKRTVHFQEDKAGGAPAAAASSAAAAAAGGVARGASCVDDESDEPAAAPRVKRQRRGEAKAAHSGDGEERGEGELTLAEPLTLMQAWLQQRRDLPPFF